MATESPIGLGSINRAPCQAWSENEREAIRQYAAATPGYTWRTV